jgi:response regulator of citrate/malate metabolism
MLTESTAALIDRGLAAIRLAKLIGQIPDDEMSVSEMARWCGVSRQTMQAFLRVSLAKAFIALREKGLPAHLVNKEPAIKDA